MWTRKTLGCEIRDVEGRFDRSNNNVTEFRNLFANEVMRYIYVLLFCMVDRV